MKEVCTNHIGLFICLFISAGNNFFKNSEFDKAADEYDAAIARLDGLETESEEVSTARRKYVSLRLYKSNCLRVSYTSFPSRSSVLSLLNRAACNLKRGRFAQVTAYLVLFFFWILMYVPDDG